MSRPHAVVRRLIERPIAHRGLHDASKGIVENTETAFRAAIEAGYGIETDIQRSADGEAVVHHDDTLGRLTEGSGRLAEMTAAELLRVPFKATADRMMTLSSLCGLIAGRVPLVVEIKSRFDGDTRLAARAAAVLASYDGPAALMSFDPAPVEALRKLAPSIARGIVAQRHYDEPEWAALTPTQKRSLGLLLHFPRTRPHFIAYWIKNLPAAPPVAARWILRIPLLTWTVRSEADRRCAARWADQMIFEQFRP